MVRFIIFFFILLFSLFLMNFVIYFSVVKAFKIDRKKRGWLILALVLATFMMILGLIFRNVSWLRETGYIWLGVLSISFTVLMINLSILLIFRRVFRITTTISLILILVLSGLALLNNIKSPTIREYDIHSEKLSDETDGFRIVLVSEFHLIGRTSKKRLENKLQIINQLDPDLVVIAGDLIDEPFDRVSHLLSSFRLLHSTHGTYSVPGNHDYYQGIDSYHSFTQAAEIYNLYNTNSRLTDEIVIAGVIDKTAGVKGTGFPDVGKAMEKIEPEDFIIFVSHQPLYNDEALGLGADLLLAGHTHGGQIPPLTLFIKLRFQYPYGLYERDGSLIYTTSGISTWGPPMRLFSRNEIVVFNLYSVDN